MMDRPWMTALEMQFAALSLATQARNEWLGSSRHHLRHAECYAFTPETVTAIAIAARTVPMDSRVDSTALSAPCGWWWFAHPIVIPGLHPTTDQCVALSWGPRLSADEPGGVEVWGWSLGRYVQFPGTHHDRWPDKPMPVCTQATPPGSTLAELLQATMDQEPGRQDMATGLWKLLLAGHVWMRQRIATFSTGHVERHRRKQLAREHNVPVPADIKVVELRRLESTPHEPRPDSEPVEWSCRWIVDGHWRNQYHPSDGRHELVYILPYVKGPADKPLKVPTHTVYAVTR